MIAKLLFCAVLCLALNQACLARPEQAGTAADKPPTDQPQPLSCRQNLKGLVVAIYNLFKVYYQGVVEFVSGLYHTLRCAFGKDFTKCSKEALSKTYENFKAIFSAYVDRLKTVGSQIYQSVKTCIGRKQLSYVEPYVVQYANNFIF